MWTHTIKIDSAAVLPTYPLKNRMDVREYEVTPWPRHAPFGQSSLHSPLPQQTQYLGLLACCSIDCETFFFRFQTNAVFVNLFFAKKTACKLRKNQALLINTRRFAKFSRSSQTKAERGRDSGTAQRSASRQNIQRISPKCAQSSSIFSYRKHAPGKHRFTWRSIEQSNCRWTGPSKRITESFLPDFGSPKV